MDEPTGSTNPKATGDGTPLAPQPLGSYDPPGQHLPFKGNEVLFIDGRITILDPTLKAALAAFLNNETGCHSAIVCRTSTAAARTAKAKPGAAHMEAKSGGGGGDDIAEDGDDIVVDVRC